MEKTVLHEFGKSLAYKVFQHQMHGQLLGAVNQQNASDSAAAREEVRTLLERQIELAAVNDRLEAENRRLKLEGQQLAGTVTALRTEVERAHERAEALDGVIEALTTSLRVYGLDRKGFRRAILSIAERTPSSGPQAIRHPTFLAAAQKVLART